MKAKLKKPTKSVKSTSSTGFLSGFQVFSDNPVILQLIIIAFLALSSLLVLHVVSQQKEIDFYKGVQANILNR